MRSGDTVRDGQGNAYQVGQLLGRGAWGKSFVVRRESDDVLSVLKLPLGPDDIPEKTPAPESFFAACREALIEQGRLYEQGNLPFLPKLEARFTTPDGLPALLVPRYAESLEKRICDGLSVGALVDLLISICKQVRTLAASGTTGAALHGGLRPSNILFSERGDVFLADVATPVVRKTIASFCSLDAGGQPYLPPEICLPAQEPPWAAVADTWAVAMILWRGIMGPAAPIAWPKRGLDKAAVADLKARLLERIKSEDSNPRFHGRLAERVGVLLSRALSTEIAPSPPYRFTRLDELVQRLEEITALIRPQVTTIGKVMMDRPAAKGWFDTGEAAQFSVTVGASTGVEGHEEIGVGIAVFDTTKEERLKDLDLKYSSDKHPSGRYRFSFQIAGLSPGQYRIRLAFAIRDSGQQPATVEADVEVRAAPGWVPPAEAPVAQALTFPRENTGVTRPKVDDLPADPALLEAPSIPRAVSPIVPAEPLKPAVKPVIRPAAPAPAAEAPAGPLPRPILPEGHDPVPAAVIPGSLTPTGPVPTAAATARTFAPAAAFATPVPPAPAATIADDEPRFEPPKNWTYEPIPKPRVMSAPVPEERASVLDDDDDIDLEPSPLQKALTALKNDPYVLVMTSLGAVIALLLFVFLALKR